MQRWALLLMAYTYDIVYRSTKAHANADGLSRLPLAQTFRDPHADDPTVFNVEQLHTLPVLAMNLAAATRSDPELSKLTIFLRDG